MTFRLRPRWALPVGSKAWEELNSSKQEVGAMEAGGADAVRHPEAGRWERRGQPSRESSPVRGSGGPSKEEKQALKGKGISRKEVLHLY